MQPIENRDRIDSGFEIALTPLGIFDLEENSRQGRVELRGAPILNLGPYVGLNRFPDRKTNFNFKFDAIGLVDASRVFEAGDNSDLEDDDNFMSVGAEVGLTWRTGFEVPFADVSTSGVELDVRYRYLNLPFGPQDSINRFTSSVKVPLTERIALGFEYVDGNNLRTFQTENRWGFNASVKY